MATLKELSGLVDIARERIKREEEEKKLKAERKTQIEQKAISDISKLNSKDYYKEFQPTQPTKTDVFGYATEKKPLSFPKNKDTKTDIFGYAVEEDNQIKPDFLTRLANDTAITKPKDILKPTTFSPDIVNFPKTLGEKVEKGIDVTKKILKATGVAMEQARNINNMYSMPGNIGALTYGLDKAAEEKIPGYKTTGEMSKTFGLGARDSLTLGLSELIKTEAEKELQSKYPKTNIAGNVAGYIVPGTAFSKAAGTALKTVLPKIGVKSLTKIAAKDITSLTAKDLATKYGINAAKIGLQEGLAGAGMEATEGILRGESASDIGKRTLIGAGLGAGLGAVASTIGQVISKSKLNKAVSNIDNAYSKYKTGLTPQNSTTQIKNNMNDVIERIKNFKSDGLSSATPIKNERPFEPIKFESKLNRDMTTQQRLNDNITPVKPQSNISLSPNKTVAENGLSVSPEVKPVSSRKLPDIHNMTQKEFDVYYGLDKKPNMKSVENLLEDTGAKIMNKTGLKDIPSIVKYYVKKYNLPDNVKVNFNLSKGTKKGSTSIIRDANGNMSGVKISINPNQSIEGKIGSLRHEIEHYIDLSKGYKPTDAKYKFNAKTDTTGRTLYNNANKGHHQQYGWFESDYLRRAAVKDAIKSGKEVPEAVMKEFPDLANYKPKTTEPIVAPVEQVTPQVKLQDIPQVTPQVKQATPKAIKQTPNKTAERPKPKGDGQAREHGFVSNVKSDANMNEKIVKNFDEATKEYNQLSNNKTLKSAQKRFDEGYDNALLEFKNTKHFRPDDIPLARMLANEAAKRGDITIAREIISKAAEKLTEAGQISQAARILRKSKDPYTFVDFIQKRIANLNEQGAKLYGDKWEKIRLPNNKIKEIYNLELYDEAAMERMMEGVHADINAQIPVSKMEKFDAWRRMAMLLNPKTHVRNLAGNLIMRGARKTSDTLAAGIERIVLGKNSELRTKTVNWSKDKDLVNIVKNDWDKVKDDLMKYNKYEIDSLNINNADKPIFKSKYESPQKLRHKISNSVNNNLEKLNTFSKNTLNLGDKIFMRPAYEDALGQIMKVRGLKEVTEEARQYATRRALEATFRQENRLATLISKGKQLKYGGRLLDAAIPFTKTPLNIFKSALEYSPGGIVKALFSKTSGKATNEVIEDLAKGLTGTGVLTAGYLLASMGWGRSERAKSKNVEGILQQSGNNSFSVDTPLGNYTFEWASPISIPLAMGMSMYESIAKQNPSTSFLDKFSDGLVSAVVSGGDTAINMSMLKNVKDLLGGYGSTTEKLMGLPVAYIEQALFPTVLGQTARFTDNQKRSTYGTSKLDTFGRVVASKTPIASRLLEPKVDVFGNDMKHINTKMGTAVDTIGNFATQYISPGNPTAYNKDKVVTELTRLYDKHKETSILPRVAPTKLTYDKQPIQLTPKEVTKFQRIMGKATYSRMQEAVNSGYDDETLMSELASIAKDSYDEAKEQILNDRGLY